MAKVVASNAEDVECASFYNAADNNVDGTAPQDHGNMSLGLNLEQIYVYSQSKESEYINAVGFHVHDFSLPIWKMLWNARESASRPKNTLQRVHWCFHQPLLDHCIDCIHQESDRSFQVAEETTGGTQCYAE